MILSVSRRTDVPNYYADWFLNRLKAGFLYVRNPMNPRQVSRIPLSPEVVDCIVFWTKHPKLMLPRLNELRDYPYYFQFTLTGYGRDIEPNIPEKHGEMLAIFRELSEKVGKKRVIWRYDPIFVNHRYTAEYHLRAFEKIARELCGHTERVVISFMDMYAKTRRNTANLGIRELTEEEMLEMAGRISAIAKNYGLRIESCAERIDLEPAGISHGSCIDKRLIEEILKCEIRAGKDKNQRSECGCVESVEVGTYHTCPNGCRYCYANFSDEKVHASVELYDAASPMLCGSVGPEDKITERIVRSLKIQEK